MPYDIEKPQKCVFGKLDLESKKIKTKLLFDFCFPKSEIEEHIFGKNSALGFLGIFCGVIWKSEYMLKVQKERCFMRKKGFKGRCEKRKIGKCKDILRTYDPIQYAYADVLQKKDEIKEIRVNIPLEDCEYTTDFVCIKSNDDLMVRECVQRKYLMKPLTVKLLDISREYWLRHGVTDWGVVIDAAEV